MVRRLRCQRRMAEVSGAAYGVWHSHGGLKAGCVVAGGWCTNLCVAMALCERVGGRLSMQRVVRSAIWALPLPVTLLSLGAEGANLGAADTLAHPALQVRSSSFDSYRAPSAVTPLLGEITAFTTELEARVLAGELTRPVQTFELEPLPPIPEGTTLTAEQKALRVVMPRDLQVVARPELREEVVLGGFFTRLAEVRQGIAFPNYYERRQLNLAESSLVRAYDCLRVSLGDPSYTGLEAQHEAWRKHYHRLVMQAQYRLAVEFLRLDAELKPIDALTRAKSDITSVPYPRMRFDRAYPEVDIPPLVAGVGGAAVTGTETFEAGKAIDAALTPASDGTSIEEVTPAAPDLMPEQPVDDAPSLRIRHHLMGQPPSQPDL